MDEGTGSDRRVGRRSPPATKSRLGLRPASAAGDADGDGVPDLAAGGPGHDDETSLVGYVQILTCEPGGSPWYVGATQAGQRALGPPPTK